MGKKGPTSLKELSIRERFKEVGPLREGNYSVRAEAASIFLPKKIAFMKSLLPPNQNARKLGLSAIFITLPFPTVQTTTAAEFLMASAFSLLIQPLCNGLSP